MYRRILAPVDGSAVSTLGLRHAIALAKSQRARLRILNVLGDIVPALGGYSAAGVEAALARGSGDTSKAIREAAALAAKSRVKPECAVLKARGRFASEVIVADARRWGADLVVMGTHGRRGLNRLLMGSDAQRVLGDAPVPVLLVRGGRPKLAKRGRAGE